MRLSRNNLACQRSLCTPGRKNLVVKNGTRPHRARTNSRLPDCLLRQMMGLVCRRCDVVVSSRQRQLRWERSRPKMLREVLFVTSANIPATHRIKTFESLSQLCTISCNPTLSSTWAGPVALASVYAHGSIRLLLQGRCMLEAKPTEGLCLGRAQLGRKFPVQL